VSGLERAAVMEQLLADPKGRVADLPEQCGHVRVFDGHERPKHEIYRDLVMAYGQHVALDRFRDEEAA
jgi:hypothetical protein